LPFAFEILNEIKVKSKVKELHPARNQKAVPVNLAQS
jgi:hypothetical protein